MNSGIDANYSPKLQLCALMLMLTLTLRKRHTKLCLWGEKLISGKTALIHIDIPVPLSYFLRIKFTFREIILELAPKLTNRI